MTPERHTAQQKQITRGNAPWQTRGNIQEVYADRRRYLTGLRYRARLNEKLGRICQSAIECQTLRRQRDCLHRNFNIFAEKYFPFVILPEDLIKVLNEILKS